MQSSAERFKKGDRVVFVKGSTGYGITIPAGTLATYDDGNPTTGVPWVRLGTGERVPAWRDSIAHAEPETSAPLDPSGRHDLAADFFHAKTGTAASYFTVDLSPDERAPYYAAADAFLAAQPAPEPEPEWKPGQFVSGVVEGTRHQGMVDDLGNFLFWNHESEGAQEEPLPTVTDVRPLVVIDPADVDVKAIGAALSEAERPDLSWEEIARIALAEVGIEVPR